MSSFLENQISRVRSTKLSSSILLISKLSLFAKALPVEPDGPEVAFYDAALPEAAVTELQWCAAAFADVSIACTELSRWRCSLAMTAVSFSCAGSSTLPAETTHSAQCRPCVLF